MARRSIAPKEDLFGIPIIVSNHVTPGTMLLINNDASDAVRAIIVDRLTLFQIERGRTPFWTRNMTGVKEAERDRKKYGKESRARRNN